MDPRGLDGHRALAVRARRADDRGRLVAAAQPGGYPLLAASILGTVLIWWIIDPKLRAVSANTSSNRPVHRTERSADPRKGGGLSMDKALATVIGMSLAYLASLAGLCSPGGPGDAGTRRIAMTELPVEPMMSGVFWTWVVPAVVSPSRSLQPGRSTRTSQGGGWTVMLAPPARLALLAAANPSPPVAGPTPSIPSSAPAATATPTPARPCPSGWCSSARTPDSPAGMAARAIISATTSSTASRTLTSAGPA